MKKRIGVLGIVALMVFVFVGCGDDGSSGPTTTISGGGGGSGPVTIDLAP